MKNREKAEEMAVERVQWLSPLLAEGLDAGMIRQIKARICEQTGWSERTLRRYMARYRANGFDGLRPKARGPRRAKAALAPAVVEQAILLRREVPGRSVSQIIQTLEWEGLAQPGQVKRSTLQEKLTERGYSARHMRMYADSGVAARRFQRRHRNQLWQGDLKYGPYLPIGPGGSQKQVYLAVILDDATRLVLHGAFYATMEQTIVEDSLRQAILKYGVPERVFFDNGKQYRTKWMARTCSKLAIRLLYARPFSPEAKGKVERFNRRVGEFLAEVALDKPQTLERLNERFDTWLSECYQNKPHSALGENTSPETAYRSDRQAIRFVDPDTLRDAFLHVERRRVDKSGCVSFQGQKYEAGLSFIGCTVDVIYDPADTSAVTIEYEGHAPWQAKPLVIGERVGSRPSLPPHRGTVPADSSRLLEAAAEQHAHRREQQKPAVSYRTVAKEGGEPRV